MSLSLYAVTIPRFRKTLEAVAKLVDKAEEFCAARDIAPEELIQARLASDMLPFAYQVKSTAVHSIGAIEGVLRGTFSPDMSPPGETFDVLARRIGDARSALAALNPDEINGLVGRPMRFEIRSHV